MAGRDRMTIEEVVRRVLREEHGDVIRESVRAVVQELMEAEVAYRRLVADWKASGQKAGAGATPERASSRPSKGKAARQATSS